MCSFAVDTSFSPPSWVALSLCCWGCWGASRAWNISRSDHWQLAWALGSCTSLLNFCFMDPTFQVLVELIQRWSVSMSICVAHSLGSQA